ncbi:MAG: twin-arginine translocation signal domain-containing protein [Flavobacterium sp.]|uniref:Gfo/Idh/MocA family protein n=1 Tax=Flavobacterium sp. TaxID=239 RepID=UPI0012259020|nr:Gfo/Idh/MocA family oxidoreductase [Flavobacterium sp.]RZJ67487.1 MAG: twin-arginine translocation signal domain-containing protein [Flavobacterium sp.]
MENPIQQNTRRDFLKHSGLAIAATIVTPSLATFAQQTSASTAKPLGLALIGLGGYSSQQLAPALEQTKNVKLVGIVTGTPSKAKAWKKKYNIPEANIYDYKNFDEIANNKDIDIVYVVLPNSMHKEFTVRAAKAGIDLVGEEALQKSLDAAGADEIQGEDNLYAATLGADIVSNTMYFATIGAGGAKNLWPRAIAMGIAAGVGAVTLPEPMGLDDAPVADTTQKQGLTVGYYVFGALVTAGLLKLMKA